MTINLNETILVAFAFGSFIGDDFYSAWLGWVELCYCDDGVHIVNNTVPMTTGPGIFAGTYNIIPEPSCALLTLSGVALLLSRRRTRAKVAQAL